MDAARTAPTNDERLKYNKWHRDYYRTHYARNRPGKMHGIEIKDISPNAPYCIVNYHKPIAISRDFHEYFIRVREEMKNNYISEKTKRAA